MPLVGIIVVVSVIYAALTLGLCIAYAELSCGDMALTPKGIHDVFELTWVGTIITFLVFIVIFIWAYIILILYIIFKGKIPDDVA